MGNYVQNFDSNYFFGEDFSCHKVSKDKVVSHLETCQRNYMDLCFDYLVDS